MDDPLDDDRLNFFTSGGGRRPMWFDRQGQPITMREANELLGSDERVVKQETIGDYFVSTCHLVLDHNHWGGPPLIFETMVFLTPEAPAGKERPDWCGEAMMRTATEEAALAMHDQVAAMVRDHVASEAQA
jgi:hypothetical protein